MSRIFKQLGHGYGAAPVSIVAQIDGNTVFSGTVPTTDAPVPFGPEPGVQLGLPCFDWTEPVANFVGTRSFSISVIGGVFQIGETLAQGNIANVDQYGSPYESTVGNVTYGDALSQVFINSAAQTYQQNPQLPGAWGWTLDSGDTLTATLTINVLEQPIQPPLLPWNIANAYLARDRVVTENDALYLALVAVPIGVDITDESYWLLGPQLEWTPSISYASGYFVRYPLPGLLYKSLQAVPEGIEITDAAHWQQWTFGD